MTNSPLSWSFGSSRTASNLTRKTLPYFAIGLMLLMLGFLIGPRVAESQQARHCLGNVQLVGPFGFGLNCDSPQFMELAATPSRLLEPGNWRQSRPGLIALAAAVRLPFAAALPTQLPFVTTNTSGPPSPTEITASFEPSLPAYLAYVFFNIFFLLSSFWVLGTLVVHDNRDEDSQTTAALLAIGLLLVANDVTKAFVWSPHTQMFNILVPLLAVRASLRAWQGAILDRRWVAFWGLLIGLGLTAYAVFFVVLACVLCVILFTLATRKLRWQLVFQNGALLLLLSALPYALWYTFVRLRTGSFFQAEVSIGEVTWIAESWSKGFTVFVFDWIAHAWGLITLAAPQAAPIFILVMWVVLSAVWNGCLKDIWRTKQPELLIPVFVSLVTLAFYTCVGLLVDRLAYAVIPPLLVTAGLIGFGLLDASRQQSKNGLVFGCVLIALVQVVHVIVKDGPWS